MFIVIDGIDGSGKGTQVKLIAENLKKIGKTVKILDYPRYGEKSAFAIEKYLNGDYGKNITAKQASIFYAMDRFDDSFNVKKDYKKYDYIISNRYVSANMIHQAGKIKDKIEREDFLKWLDELEYNIFNIVKPDKIFFLNVSPEMSQKLVCMKEDRNYLKGGKKMDLHEEDKLHLINAHNVAIELSNKYPNWVQINCEKDKKIRKIEDINADILNKII